MFAERLKKLRLKIARVSGAIKIADRRIVHYWEQARNRRKHGHNAQADYKKKKAEAWMRRKHWLQGKKIYLTQTEKEVLHKREIWQKNHPTPVSGWATWNGIAIAAWMKPWLEKSQAHGWTGYVTSGVRTPAHSVELCYAMCGASSCPGRCAGASSNHNCTAGCPYPTGAVDVTDYYNFERIQYEIGSPLRNHLPADPVHFSVSGY